jgi:hypothetical protein
MPQIRGGRDLLYKRSWPSVAAPFTIAALDRALEPFDLTATDPPWSLARRREILRARDQFCRVFFDASAEPDLADYLRSISYSLL